MDDRTEEQIASRSPLTVMVGGEPRELPVLTRRESRKWKALLQQKLGLFLADVNDVNTFLERGVVNLADEILVELVLAYDTTGVLGGAEALDDMTDLELLEAYRAMGRVTFPLGAADLSQMGLFGAIAPSPMASSTNGHSPTGTSSRKRSTTSPTSS